MVPYDKASDYKTLTKMPSSLLGTYTNTARVKGKHNVEFHVETLKDLSIDMDQNKTREALAILKKEHEKEGVSFERVAVVYSIRDIRAGEELLAFYPLHKQASLLLDIFFLYIHIFGLSSTVHYIHMGVRCLRLSELGKRSV